MSSFVPFVLQIKGHEVNQANQGRSCRSRRHGCARWPPRWESKIHMQNRTHQVKPLQATTLLRLSEAKPQLDAHQVRSDVVTRA
jgi:hypothetical protein